MAGDQSTLTFVTESLPTFVAKEPTTVELEVSGGTPPYIFEITKGTLPRGLYFSRRGRISGAAQKAANVTVNIKVTDNDGASLTQAFQVLVAES